MMRRLLFVVGLMLATVTPMAFSPAADAQTYGNSVTIEVAFPGGSVKISVCCFAPGTPVNITINVSVTPGSTAPTQAMTMAAAGGSSATAAPDGTAVLSLAIPPNAAPGPMPVTISGTPAPDSGTPAVQQAVIPVQAMAPAVNPVVAPVAQAATTTTTTGSSAVAAATGDPLPVTGTDLTGRLSLIAVVLLATGATALLAGRRRSDDTTS